MNKIFKNIKFSAINLWRIFSNAYFLHSSLINNIKHILIYFINIQTKLLEMISYELVPLTRDLNLCLHL